MNSMKGSWVGGLLALQSEAGRPSPMRNCIQLLLALLLCTIGCSVGWAQARPQHLYGVIFEVTSDAGGKVATLKVVSVMDPATGSRDPVKLDIPDEFLAAARVELLKRDYPPSSHFYTYNFYDPQRPGKADIDPKAKAAAGASS